MAMNWTKQLLGVTLCREQRLGSSDGNISGKHDSLVLIPITMQELVECQEAAAGLQLIWWYKRREMALLNGSAFSISRDAVAVS